MNKSLNIINEKLDRHDEIEKLVDDLNRDKINPEELVESVVAKFNYLDSAKPFVDYPVIIKDGGKVLEGIIEFENGNSKSISIDSSVLYKTKSGKIADVYADIVTLYSDGTIDFSDESWVGNIDKDGFFEFCRHHDCYIINPDDPIVAVHINKYTY